MTQQELAALLEDLIRHCRGAGLDDEQIAARLQDATGALVNGMS